MRTHARRTRITCATRECSGMYTIHRVRGVVCECVCVVGLAGADMCAGVRDLFVHADMCECAVFF